MPRVIFMSLIDARNFLAPLLLPLISGFCMKHVALPSMLISSLMLAACGGGADGGDAQATSQNAMTTNQVQNIGSSLTGSEGVDVALAASITTVSWQRCAVEYGVCSFSGTRQVRYGFNGQYAVRTATGRIECSNEVFGDPFVGADKACDYAVQSTASAPAPAPAPAP